jgi:hypothetical protein
MNRSSKKKKGVRKDTFFLCLTDGGFYIIQPITATV